MNKIIALITTLFFITACAAPYAPQDLPQLSTEQILWFQVDKLDADGNPTQTSLLSVQGESNGATRWVQTDAFGVPQARMLAQANGWQQDGFAPPNREARALFVAMFPHIKRGFRQPEILQTDAQRWKITPIEQPESE